MSVNEIFNLWGSTIVSHVEGEWEKAVLNLEIQRGMTGFNGGYYFKSGEFKSFALKQFPRNIGVKELHEITTKGGQNRWNRARFTVTPDRKFDMEFIWDQEWQDRIDQLNK
jgi:hypothetical protein